MMITSLPIGSAPSSIMNIGSHAYNIYAHIGYPNGNHFVINGMMTGSKDQQPTFWTYNDMVSNGEVKSITSLWGTTKVQSLHGLVYVHE